MYKLLLVNKDLGVLDELAGVLKSDDYELVRALTVETAMKKAREHLPDMVITDLMLIDSDGIDLCSQIRNDNLLAKTFVVLYSEHNENYSQIAAYKAGADDYIVAPISPILLNCKLQAILSRSRDKGKHKIVRINGLIVDKEKHLVKLADAEVVLPKKEFEILELLVSDPQKVFTRDEMKERIWGMGAVVRNRTIDVHIRKLRESIGDRMITTIKGVGYKFNSN